MNCYILTLFCTVYVYMKSEQWDAQVECTWCRFCTTCTCLILDCSTHVQDDVKYSLIAINSV